MHVPKSWRVCLVPPVPILFDKAEDGSPASLLYNLHLGACTEFSHEQILQLASQMGLSKRLVERPLDPVGADGQCLSLSDRVIVATCRAIIAGVDVLLFSKGIDLLAPKSAERVLKQLRIFVDERGFVANTPSGAVVPKKLRLPKLVVLISNSARVHAAADTHIQLDGRGGHRIAPRAVDQRHDLLPPVIIPHVVSK